MSNHIFGALEKEHGSVPKENERPIRTLDIQDFEHDPLNAASGKVMRKCMTASTAV